MVSLGALGPSLDAAAQVLAAALGFFFDDDDGGGGGMKQEEAGASMTLRQQGVRVVLDAAGDPAWAEALRRAFHRPQGMHILEEPVPHSWLLRKCRCATMRGIWLASAHVIFMMYVQHQHAPSTHIHHHK